MVYTFSDIESFLIGDRQKSGDMVFELIALASYSMLGIIDYFIMKPFNKMVKLYCYYL